MLDLFVKLSVTYYDDIAIVCVDDAAEVMFVRGICLCGRLETGGFIPDAKILELTRRNTMKAARRIADSLCRPPADGVEAPWVRVEGGYQVRSWRTWQERLDALSERRRSDRQRQAKRRAAGKKPGLSRDSHVTVTDPEKEKEEDTAAAAADTRGSSSDLDPAIAIFADRLRAWTPLAALRFDRLSTEQTRQLADLIALHGDQRLVDVAKTTTKTPPPVLVNAYLGTWAALPAPGQRLAAVPEPKCGDCHQIRRAHPWPGCSTYIDPETRTA